LFTFNVAATIRNILRNPNRRPDYSKSGTRVFIDVTGPKSVNTRNFRISLLVSTRRV